TLTRTVEVHARQAGGGGGGGAFGLAAILALGAAFCTRLARQRAPSGASIRIDPAHPSQPRRRAPRGATKREHSCHNPICFAYRPSSCSPLRFPPAPRLPS